MKSAPLLPNPRKIERSMRYKQPRQTILPYNRSFPWLVLFGLILGSVACGPKQVKVRRDQITPLYSMSLPQTDNVDFPFSSLRGKVVVVDFFASYCMPCLHIIPKLKKLYANNRQKGFLVVGVALERQVSQILQPFINYLRIDYPVLVADSSIYQGSTIFGKIRRIPRSVLIDRCGKIRRVFVGVPDMKTMQGAVQELLDQKASTCNAGR